GGKEHGGWLHAFTCTTRSLVPGLIVSAALAGACGGALDQFRRASGTVGIAVLAYLTPLGGHNPPPRAAVEGRTADRPGAALADDRCSLHGKLHVQSPFGPPGAGGGLRIESRVEGLSEPDHPTPN